MVNLDSVWPLLWTALGVLGLWLVISVPAYAVLTVWRQLRGLLDGLRSRLSAVVGVIRARLEANATRSRDELSTTIRVLELDPTAKAAWHETVEPILADAHKMATQAESAVAQARASHKVFEPVVRRLRKLRLVSETVPSIPDLPAGQRSTERSRVAATNFVVVSLLLMPIIPANAQMTALVLGSILPPLEPVFGVLPVSFALALILVLVEAALGVLLAAEAEAKEGTERWFSLGTVLYSLAGVGVVTMEAALYGLVDPGEIIRLPIGGSVFALMGAVLGVAVFGLGHLWNRSLLKIRKERTLRSVRKELERLRHAAEEWNGLADRVQPQQASALIAFEKLAEVCTQGVNTQTKTLQRLLDALRDVAAALPPWAKSVERPLTNSEFTERVSRAYLWLAVGLISLGALLTVCGATGLRMSAVTGTAVGAGLGVAAWAIGSFCVQVGRRPSSIGVSAGAAGVLLLCLLTSRFLRSQVSLHWILVAVPAIGAYLAGAQTGRDVAFLRLPLRFIWNAAAVSVLWIPSAVVAIVFAAVVVVEHVMWLFAWPVAALIDVIRTSRRGAYTSVA
jgi:hypothetical protein